MSDKMELASEALTKGRTHNGASLAAAILLAACGSGTTVIEQLVPTDAGAGGTTSAVFLPTPTLSPDDLGLNTFGVVGNRYWLDASEEQVTRMNARLTTLGGDRYTPPGAGDPTFVDHLLVTSAGDNPQTADLGKIQVRLVGNTTARLWTLTTLPNFKLDADEFVPQNRIGGEEHLRFNNAVSGTIFREKLVYDIFNRLGYPAPRASFAWVSGSVWGPGVAVPYVVVESYKRPFCERHADQLGGRCPNIWEFPRGDLWLDSLEDPENCQLRECNPGRTVELAALVAATAPGVGFKVALGAWVDWSAFHRYQCLSWALELADDNLRLSNVVLVERGDGKFQYLPYSVDVSITTEFGPVSLAGESSLAIGCQADPQCWADTIVSCDAVLGELVAISPVTLLDDIRNDLDRAGMLRPGDDESYASLREHLQLHLDELPAILDQNRLAPLIGVACSPPLTQCAQYCVLPERCDELFPPQVGGDAGVASEGGHSADAGIPE
jgi:hypothetical protein